MDKIRQRVLDLAKTPGKSLAAASEAAGMNSSYMHQFVSYEKPKILPESVRLAVAAFWGVDEAELRDGPSKTAPRNRKQGEQPSYSRRMPMARIPLNEGEVSLSAIEEAANALSRAVDGRLTPTALALRLRDFLEEMEAEKKEPQGREGSPDDRKQ